MQVFKAIADFRRWREGLGGRLGFVPTMGYLHAGHLSLAAAAKSACRHTVVSIFVNPTQFGPSEDFARYPRDLDRDLQLCEGAGVDGVFAPEVHEMYPAGSAAAVKVARLTEPLCGRTRPTHFEGVTTVVAKLFNIVQPQLAFFGQKDLQQSIVVRRMTEDLNFPVEVRVCPIVREEDGLALSSRNRYLNPAERRQAVVLSRALQRAQALFSGGERRAAAIAAAVRRMIEEVIGAAGSIDYAELVSVRDLAHVETAAAGDAVVLAVFIGKTRLIDNLILS